VAESPLTTILVAADAEWVRKPVRSAFVGRGQRVVEVDNGFDVRPAVAADPPDLIVLDLNIGNMGGIAVALDLHLEAAAGRLPHIPILLLLDRAADRFLAVRAAVDAELVKPVDAGTLRRTAKRLLSAAATGAPRPEPTVSAPIES
jgi:DNA-binding response OmpR family regulator